MPYSGASIPCVLQLWHVLLDRRVQVKLPALQEDGHTAADKVASNGRYAMASAGVYAIGIPFCDVVALVHDQQAVCIVCLHEVSKTGAAA